MSPTEPFLPPHMVDGMRLYVEHGIPPGSFMMSVLENNLKESVGRADHINLRFLTNIVSYCYNNIPREAWGSPERVQLWVSMHRQRREREDEKNESD